MANWKVSPTDGQEAATNYGSISPPYLNWQEAVPDTASFPPPPALGFLSSRNGNASRDDAERAHEFCDKFPLHLPVKPSATVYTCVQEHDLRPVLPKEFHGTFALVSQGYWKGSTRARNGDTLVSTNLPLYFPTVDSPFITEKSKTIYFEVKLLGLREGPGPVSTDSSGFSIGFTAHPYPYWRSPGWERGSIGVFSDDGCRFVNDSWGGREFTSAFAVGETVGLGMTFRRTDNSSTDLKSNIKKCKVDIFFTRNGHPVGGWDLHEEIDEDAGRIEGLEGDFDLYGAIGLFGGVDFEIALQGKHSNKLIDLT
ncbi:hypothetical protein COH20_012700 [Aspergillus flavus]|uniref:SPRY domain-containing protein n=1 Tax=Aspergillus flavus TaxID=5059 RepID=A0AB74C7F4_ASPFL|nr:hypothetical protein NYO67_10408 [Aspergillus flavus]RAQ60537.1 hypothetical protein COH20_012700 [Aspergillus flavus]RMZ41507.1 hypothetical protein CA14_012436 [Aspergillus flavus]